jgi:hypothetical protein
MSARSMRLVWAAVLVSAAGGCGRILYAPGAVTVPDADPSGADAGDASLDSAGTDGAGLDASGTDAADLDAGGTDGAGADATGRDSSVPPSCDWSAGPALGPATTITLAITAHPALSADGASLYYAHETGVPSTYDLFVAPRTSATSFGGPTAITELNTRGAERSLVVSADGLYGILARDAGGAADLLELTRAGASDPWTTGVAIPAITTGFDEVDPHLSPDGLRLWFSRSCDLFASRRATRSSAWEAPTAMTELDNGDCESSPTLTDDELLIVFISNAAPGPGMGDAWYATRARADVPFDAPILVPGEVDTASFESDPFVRGDGCELFWLSQRSGSLRLYIAPFL